MEHPVFFDSWPRLAEIALAAVVIYALLVVMLRVSGKRTLTKLNAFDFVVTVALGSMVATTILDDQTTIFEGAVGIAVLIALQAAVSVAVARSKMAQKVVKSRPRMLFYRGEFLREALRGERVADEEIQHALREAGYASFEDVLAVVLETDGSMSVVGSGSADAPTESLDTVRGRP